MLQLLDTMLDYLLILVILIVMFNFDQIASVIQGFKKPRAVDLDSQFAELEDEIASRRNKLEIDAVKLDNTQRDFDRLYLDREWFNESQLRKLAALDHEIACARIIHEIDIVALDRDETNLHAETKIRELKRQLAFRTQMLEQIDRLLTS